MIMKTVFENENGIIKVDDFGAYIINAKNGNTIFRSKMAAIKYSNTYLKSKGRSIYDCIIVKVC